MKSEVSKREKNKEAIREQLLVEAKKLFSEKGMQNTTVSDIVAACNLGRGTFYNYFSDVKHIFDKVNEIVNIEIGNIIKTARAQQSTIYDIFYATFKTYFDFSSGPEMLSFNQKNQAYIRSASYKSDAIRTIVKDLQADLRRNASKLKLASDIDEQLLSYLLMGTPAELFLNNMSVAPHLDNHKVATFLARLFTHGVGKQ